MAQLPSLFALFGLPFSEIKRGPPNTISSCGKTPIGCSFIEQ
ncbi:hypothetical protein BSM4216_0657 [Bacillus smithii]|nr:hypothetical protein BSM4216_0657 [Bacillus smithii]